MVLCLLQAKHIGLLKSFDNECQHVTEQKLATKRKAADEPLLKQPKIITATTTLTRTMLDHYVLVCCLSVIFTLYSLLYAQYHLSSVMGYQDVLMIFFKAG